MPLQDKIEHYALLDANQLIAERTSALDVFAELRGALNSGEVRAASPDNFSPSGWKTNSWVKRGILLGFRLGQLFQLDTASPWQFFDKDTLPLRNFDLDSGVRIVPGGSSVRDGAFVAPSVIVMPPAYVNIGAYVGSGTLIDSHALVGSCAQIGERVHISAAAQVGGVLEPAGALPVIIEDDVLLGGNTGIYEGCVIKQRAVIASGVVLTGSTPVYDVVHSKVITRSDLESPLIIPEGAVIVAGSRQISGKSDFAREYGLSIYTPIIVKYRDAKTDSRTALESALR